MYSRSGMIKSFHFGTNQKRVFIHPCFEIKNIIMLKHNFQSVVLLSLTLGEFCATKLVYDIIYKE